MELYELKDTFSKLLKTIADLKEAYHYKEKTIFIKEKEETISNPDFWLNPDKKLVKEIKYIKGTLGRLDKASKELTDVKVMFELLKEDNSFFHELETEIIRLTKEIHSLELEVLLSKQYDQENAIVEIHSGAGGTEAQDWADMLFRMYKGYASKYGFKLTVLDLLDGEEAGIKSVSFLIEGTNAYGFLKGETGVHRLVRISPFDANKRRHTSFASVYVVPDIEGDIDIVISDKDVRVDTYRSSGAGGQHINKTESAIRITHIPTGIVVTCQSERSQIQNRERAFQVLKMKLLKLEEEAQLKKINEIGGTKNETSFGSQIRSYVFHPYSLIKDLRTQYEETNVVKVMDGEITGFIDSFLKSEYNRG